MEHGLHVGVVPALDEAAGVLRVILHGDDAAPLDHDGDILLPAVAEFGRLGGVVAVLKGCFIAAGRQ